MHGKTDIYRCIDGWEGERSQFEFSALLRQQQCSNNKKKVHFSCSIKFNKTRQKGSPLPLHLLCRIYTKPKRRKRGSSTVFRITLYLYLTLTFSFFLFSSFWRSLFNLPLTQCTEFVTQKKKLASRKITFSFFDCSRRTAFLFRRYRASNIYLKLEYSPAPLSLTQIAFKTHVSGIRT